jgi:MFS transporter, PAT family, beta-lactamase induction signal transducer AmpG
MSQPPNSVAVVFTRKTLVCAMHGFSSGIPFYLLVSLLPAWLRTNDVPLAQIAALNWVRLPYSWKFLWAPLVDRLTLGILSRRRDWAFVTQCALMLVVAGMGWLQPRPDQSLRTVAVLAFATAMFSATQDIALDAYRRELLTDLELGLGNSIAVNGYRAAGLVPGGIALYLAQDMAWVYVFHVVAVLMLVGVLGTYLAPPLESTHTPPNLSQAFVEPLKEFLGRDSANRTALLLAFLLLYKFGDNLATALVTPFYLDLGFTLREIGTLVKMVSLWSTIGGSVLGGWLMTRIGINKALWLFGIAQMVAILGYAVLSEVGRHLPTLGVVVFLEYFGIGLGSAAFVAFLSRITSRRYSATQFALLSSLVSVPGIAAGSSAGLLIERIGYTSFFVLSTILAIPGLLLLPWVAPWREPRTDGT